jgi:hypothetical protein
VEFSRVDDGIASLAGDGVGLRLADADVAFHRAGIGMGDI